jgi:hypothetical protein
LLEVPAATEQRDDIGLVHAAREQYVPTLFERKHQQRRTGGRKPRQAASRALPDGVGQSLDAPEVL